MRIEKLPEDSPDDYQKTVIITFENIFDGQTSLKDGLGSQQSAAMQVNTRRSVEKPPYSGRSS